MIHIFFVCGMYGHMIDYVINRFGYNDENFTTLTPRFDGSMHHGKASLLVMHHGSIKDFDRNVDTSPRTSAPFYPLVDAKFTDVVEMVSKVSPNWKLDRKIVVTSQTQESAELNLLFQYHKVATGVRNAGIEIFHSGIADTPFKFWNQGYQKFECMHRWEYREWFSKAWKDMVKDWMVHEPLGSDWLILDNQDLIQNLASYMRLIFTHCDLPWDDHIEEFLQIYRSAQQYIIDELALVNKICCNTVNQQDFKWQDLNVIAESLIQSKLRDQGYEIRCDGLNQFPTDSASLANVLYSTRVS